MHRDVICSQIGVSGIVFSDEETPMLCPVELIIARSPFAIGLEPYVVNAVEILHRIGAHSGEAGADRFEAAVFVAGGEDQVGGMAENESVLAGSRRLLQSTV